MLHLKCCRLSTERFPFFQLCMRLHLYLCDASLTPLLFFFFCSDGDGTEGPARARRVSISGPHHSPSSRDLTHNPVIADASLGPAVSPCFSHLRHCCFPGAHRPAGLHILSHLTVPASTPSCLPPMVCHTFVCVFLSAITRTAGCV